MPADGLQQGRLVEGVDVDGDFPLGWNEALVSEALGVRDDGLDDAGHLSVDEALIRFRFAAEGRGAAHDSACLPYCCALETRVLSGSWHEAGAEHRAVFISMLTAPLRGHFSLACKTVCMYSSLLERKARTEAAGETHGGEPE